MSEYILAPEGNDKLGDGSEAKPFRTMTKVMSILQPGDVVLVKGALVPFGAMIVNGTPDAPITIRPYDATGMMMLDGEYKFPAGAASGANPVTGVEFVYNGLWTLKDSSHIVIERLDMARSRGRAFNLLNVTGFTLRRSIVHDIRHGIVIGDNCTNVLLEDCEFYHGGDFYPADRAYNDKNDNIPGGIKFINSTNFILRGCKIHENWCIAFSPASNCTDWLIEDCRIWDNYGVSVYVHRAQNGVIRKNHIWNTNAPAFLHGGDPGSLIALNNESDDKFGGDINVKNIRVMENVLAGGDTLFAIWGNQGGTDSTQDVEVFYNTMINATRNGKRVAETIKIGQAKVPPTNIKIQYNAISQKTGKVITNSAGNGVLFSDNGIAPASAYLPNNEPVLFALPDALLLPVALNLSNYALIVYTDGQPVADMERRFWTVGALENIPAIVLPPDPQILRNQTAYASIVAALAAVTVNRPNDGGESDHRYTEAIRDLEHTLSHFEHYVVR